MRNRNYHPIFSDAPSHMGGNYLLQSIARSKPANAASLKKLAAGSSSNQSLLKGLPRVESIPSLKATQLTGKLPKIGFVRKNPSLVARDVSPPRGSLGAHSIKTRPPDQLKKPDLQTVLNCSSLEHPEPGLDSEEDKFGDQLAAPDPELEDMKGYIRNAKSYKIDELALTNDSFMKSTVPVEMIKSWLTDLGGNFTEHKLTEKVAVANLIIDQPFESIKKVRAVREVSLLVLSMIKFNLILEEVKFINSVALLLEGFELVLKEDPSPKFVNRLFDTLQYIVKLDIQTVPAQTQCLYQAVDFLNDLGEKLSGLPAALQEQTLKRALELLTEILPQLVENSKLDEAGTNQFLKNTESNPWLFFERLCEDQAAKSLLLSSTDCQRELCQLVMYCSDEAMAVKENDLSNTRTPVVIADHFGLLFVLLRNADIRRKLLELVNEDTVCISRLTDCFLSLVHRILQNSFFHERAQDKLERVNRLCIRCIAQISQSRALDVEGLVGSILKVLREKYFEMHSTHRINFSAELALLMREIAMARKEQFIKAFKNHRRNLDSLVITFNEASSTANKKDFQRQKEQFLKPLIETMGLLKTS